VLCFVVRNPPYSDESGLIGGFGFASEGRIPPDAEIIPEFEDYVKRLVLEAILTAMGTGLVLLRNHLRREDKWVAGMWAVGQGLLLLSFPLYGWLLLRACQASITVSVGALLLNIGFTIYRRRASGAASAS